MGSKENSRVRITVLLDDKTLAYLRKYHFNLEGTTNVSKAIMSMVKEHETTTKENSRW